MTMSTVAPPATESGARRMLHPLPIVSRMTYRASESPHGGHRNFRQTRSLPLTDSRETVGQGLGRRRA